MRTNVDVSALFAAMVCIREGAAPSSLECAIPPRQVFYTDKEFSNGRAGSHCEESQLFFRALALFIKATGLYSQSEAFFSHLHIDQIPKT